MELLSIISTSRLPSDSLNPSLAGPSPLHVCWKVDYATTRGRLLSSTFDPAQLSTLHHSDLAFRILSSRSQRFSGHSGLGALVANIGSARRDARRNLLRPFEQQHTLPIRVPKEQPRINSHVTFTPDRARLAFMKLAAADV